MHPSALSSTFSFEIQPDRERVYLRIAGELDLVTSPVVETTLTDLLDVGWRQIVIDLRALSFLESTGLRTLIEATRCAHARDCVLTLIPGPHAVQRLFALTGTQHLFTFDEKASGGKRTLLAPP